LVWTLRVTISPWKMSLLLGCFERATTATSMAIGKPSAIDSWNSEHGLANGEDGLLLVWIDALTPGPDQLTFPLDSPPQLAVGLEFIQAAQRGDDASAHLITNAVAFDELEVPWLPITP
jgi:hypothetical protein